MATKTRRNKLIFGVLSVVLFIALLLQFDWIAEPMAKATGATVQAIKDASKSIAAVATAIVLVMVGISLMGAAPIVGALFVGSGLFLGWKAIWPYVQDNSKVRPEA